MYMSAGGFGLETWAKTVKSLSSILSALSSVLSDPTAFLMGGFPPSQLTQIQISVLGAEIQRKSLRKGLLNIYWNNVVNI